jgi:hypothetical protein
MNRNNILESMKTGRDIYFRDNHIWKILDLNKVKLPILVKNNLQNYKKYFNG